MKLKCLGCHALTRLVYLSAAYSHHLVDVTLMPIGLHNQPLNLRVQLQALIDDTVGQGYDAIVLAYGLCGQATAGLTARDIPLVLPRAHDCITLFLGSRTRYQEEFAREPGTYWYVQDYIERREGKGTSLSIGAGLDTNIDEVYDEYVQKYGKDNADYLMEVMGAWQHHYKRAVYIDMGVGDGHQVEEETRSEAARRGWTYEQMAGNLVLIRQLLGGEWGTDFLVVQPGERIAMAYGEDVVRSTPILLE
ncbi:MAG: DUF1638 domain-containing protein [Caldilineaceae bacterium]|nr:DUF1638 domain-containing protein [Caldilineaceae bacterium]